MRKFGLIGYPLDHSFSAQYFTNKFVSEGITNARYELYPLEEIDRLPLLLANENLSGFNVTIPYKEQVIPYLDKLDTEAAMIGSVNCVSIQRINDSAVLTGYNTDAAGFERTLLPVVTGKEIQALILGNGGSAKTVKYVLDKLGIRNLIVSRSTTMFGYVDIDKAILDSYHLIINTTPLGMFPQVDMAPEIPYHFLSHHHICYDLIYNPDKSKFLALAEEQQATIINGREMLTIQAEESWRIWNS